MRFSMAHRGHWYWPDLTKTLITLLAPFPTAANVAEYNTTGFDHQSYSTPSKIKTLCMTPEFYYSPVNVADAEVVEYYGNWTEEHFPDNLNKDGRDQIAEVGKLLGYQNFECKFTDGHCSYLPTCDEIAETMGLTADVEPDKATSDELRRRYFLAQMLDKTMQYYHELDVSLARIGSYSALNLLRCITGRDVSCNDRLG